MQFFLSVPLALWATGVFQGFVKGGVWFIENVVLLDTWW